MDKKTTSPDVYILDESKLCDGDIILTTTSLKVSKLIRSFTGGEFSHAMLYVGGHCCIDSTTNGVQAHNTQRIAFTNSKYCKVLRYKDKLSEEQILTITTFARNIVGTAYSIPEAILAGVKIRKSNKEPNRQFCSRLIAQSYNSTGFKIVENPDYSSPEDINNSDQLIKVENPLRLANEAEKEIALEENTPQKRHADIQNYVFKEAKKITGFDIQTFQQFNQTLLDSPILDELFFNILFNSGYLDEWKNDLATSPWFYDYNIFKEYFDDKERRIECGKNQLIEEKRIKENLQTTYYNLLDSFKQRPLKTLLIQFTLYQQLIDLSDKRAIVWKQASEE